MRQCQRRCSLATIAAIGCVCLVAASALSLSIPSALVADPSLLLSAITVLNGRARENDSGGIIDCATVPHARNRVEVGSRPGDRGDGAVLQLRHRAPPLLYSAPGSGNTFVRALLEHATGLQTGSLYTDRHISSAMPGETVAPCRSGRATGALLVIKAHPHLHAFADCNSSGARASAAPLEVALAPTRSIERLRARGCAGLAPAVVLLVRARAPL